ncbi:Kunitz/Bovine pancreatic trypsin inhibitor domain protein [Ancylostoma duodenale]|uniref:Kunitz/Bovine pancreatic trypsin inhibitor domain protein n=1 Tax=Ancylostoma duodenale TaxID=51022 RepID=A0A0C2GXW3_9BILA|nr:Kunitz/Bovine pancreatic trypsin inhibitor domain protein [Ancylostoma duodenale]
MEHSKNTVSIATCNPHASTIPATEELLLTKAHEHKCAARATSVDDTTPKDVSDLYDCIDNSKFWQGQGLDTNSHPIGVCCMNRAFTCQQPKRGESDELGSVPRWWFNGVIGSCQQFLFDPSSSDVSPNNFETLDHCESFCKDKSICSEGGGRSKNPLRNTPYDAGMRFDQLTGEQANYAVGISTRYYYNPIDGQCHPFTYNGFLGNFNNFHTQSDCQMFCARLQCTHGNPLTTGHGVPQRCQRDIDCPSTHTCAAEHAVCCPTPPEPKCPQGRAYVEYTGKFLQCGEGIGGNACPANYECHFDGLIHGCCPSKAYTCSLQLSKGIACGSGSSYRYYYNNQLKLQYVPNLPRWACFRSVAVEVDKLGDSIEIAVWFYFNVALQTCSPYTSNGCDSSLNSFKTLTECEDFCLSAGCKPGDTVYKDPNTNRPFLCNTALQNNCPTNYQCTLNSLTQEHVCCGSDSMGVCPIGEKAFMDPLSSTPRQCAMAADGKCPAGYLCRFSQNNHKYYCCGSISGTVCPGGVDFHVDEKSQMPTTCTSEGFALCPNGYTCQQQPETINYYCCAGRDKEGTNDGCPPAQYAYIADGQIKSCDPFNVDPTTCPSDYTCQWSITNQKYQCCGTRPIRHLKPNKLDDGCPRKQFALMDRRTSKPRVCTAGECCGQSGECAENEKMIGGKCVVQVKIGGACHKNDECGGGSKCIAHSCTCASDQDVVNDECVARACEPNQIILEGKCLDRAAFGESCKSSLQVRIA